jgi:uncharacterized membrane protein
MTHSHRTSVHHIAAGFLLANMVWVFGLLLLPRLLEAAYA